MRKPSQALEFIHISERIVERLIKAVL
jgi:hypothetical protein